MTGEPTQATPAFTDSVALIRRILELLGDAVQQVKAVSQAVNRHKEEPRDERSDTVFSSGSDSRRYLDRNAAGDGNTSELQAVQNRMDRIGEAAEHALTELQSNRSSIAEKCGVAVANRVGHLNYGGGGKASIRLDLHGLVRMNAHGSSSHDVAIEAQRILDNIYALNAGMVEVYGTLLQLQDASVSRS